MNDKEAWEERQRREGVFKEEEITMGHGDDGEYYGPDPMTHLLMAWQCMVRLQAPEEMRRALMEIIHALGDMQSQGELLEDDMDDEMISVMDGYGRRRRYMGGYGGSGRRRRKRSANWIPRDSTQY